MSYAHDAIHAAPIETDKLFERCRIQIETTQSAIANLHDTIANREDALSVLSESLAELKRVCDDCLIDMKVAALKTRQIRDPASPGPPRNSR